VVIYVGKGAGLGDTGYYEVRGAGDGVTLQWRYHALHLWQMEAEAFFELENPAFLALIGQTRLSAPDIAISQAVGRIQQIANLEERTKILTALVSLLQTREVITMVEKIIENSEELLLDTPYLQRMRSIGREEGVQIGREEGRVLGLREAILDGIIQRFDPAASQYRQASQILDQITQYDTLQQLHLALFEVEDMAAFMARLAEAEGA
jgi:hypothetical protein